MAKRKRSFTSRARSKARSARRKFHRSGGWEGLLSDPVVIGLASFAVAFWLTRNAHAPRPSSWDAQPTHQEPEP